MRRLLLTFCLLTMAMYLFSACGGGCPCTPNPCQNGGTCEVVGGEAECDCALGYSGLLCETVDFMKVFVTSSSFQGDFGGIAGGDAICQQEADDASLIGVFAAWLSADDVDPLSRFNFSSVPYKLVDGTIVANDWNDLTDGSIRAHFALDAFGDYWGSDEVWTNTDRFGAIISSEAIECCRDFTSKGAMAQVGITYDRTYEWTEYYFAFPCETPARIYCFQQ